MSSLKLAAGAAFAAVALAGCSTFNWNPLVAMGLRTVPAQSPTPLGPVTGTVTPKAAWVVPVGKAQDAAFRPDIEGDRAYAVSSEGVVTVVELDSGKVAGRLEAKKKVSGGVSVGDGKAVVGTLKGEVVALDLGGKQAWATSVAGEVIAPPEVSRKVVVVRTSDGRIFGLSAEDGKRRWVYQRPMPSLLLRSAAGTLVLGGDVVAGYPNGKLIGLDLEDGQLTWEATVSNPRGSTELERIADVAGLPVVDGTNVCAAAFQGKVACFEVQTRNLIWSRDLSSAHSLAYDARYVYLVDDSGAVHALDKATGASVWKQDNLKYRRLTSPMVVEGRVVVGDGFGFLHVMSADDGTLVGRLATDNTAIMSLVPATGGLLLQTAGGSLALVRL